MDVTFDIDPDVFHERKRRRITAMNNQDPTPAKPVPTSMPGIHEIAGFLPGRLEFEHELDNEAEDLVKTLEFGFVADFGGNEMVEDENDPDVKARQKWEEDKRLGLLPGQRATSLPAMVNGTMNGYHPNGDNKKLKTEDLNGNADEDADEPTQPQPYETDESIMFKLTLLESYFQKVEKRHEAKALMFDRGLLEYKKACSPVYLSDTIPMNIRNRRCKPRRRNDQEKNGSFFIA
jgi:transcriptional adapter 2-alpha